jgi:hypothetical protein
MGCGNSKDNISEPDNVRTSNIPTRGPNANVLSADVIFFSSCRFIFIVRK